MIRHEEALAATIKSAPPAPESGVPNLLDPSRGQTYFKLPPEKSDSGQAELLSVLLREKRLHTLPLTGDRVPFFEHWLQNQYRRQRFAKGETDALGEVLIGFPTLYSSRRGELATLLRFPAEKLRFLTETGEEFVPPKRRARENKLLPPPPITLELLLPELDVEVPYAVDENALSRLLGCQEEQVGMLARYLRDDGPHTPRDVISAVLRLLNASPEVEISRTAWFDEGPDPLASPDDADSVAHDWLRVLSAAVDRRAIALVRSFPLGLVWDGGAVYATHHLQRDFEDLLDGLDIDLNAPLGRYLTMRPGGIAKASHYGHTGKAPTPDQRAVADRFLGSTLTVAEGPPGTGKTALILNLAAHTLIEQWSKVTGDDDPPEAPLLLVTSTNNRAVDNVTDALALEPGPDRLPLALRVGSRVVLATTTRDLLERTLVWLETTPKPDAASAAEIRRDFRQRIADIRDAMKPVRAARAADETMKELHQERLELEERLVVADRARADRDRERGSALPGDADASLVAECLLWVRSASRAASKALRRHVRFSEKPRVDNPLAPADLDRAMKSWAEVWSAVPEPGRELLESCGLLLLPDPPDDEATGDEWHEAFESLDDLFDDATHDLQGRLTVIDVSREDDPEFLRERLDAVDLRIAALKSGGAPIEVLESHLRATLDELESGLFDHARLVRELWAAENRDRLVDAVRQIIKEVEGRGSLRTLAERGGPFRELLRLFPVWGCTLLSIANVFPATPRSIARVVVDEAGQVHPAHVVSALYRAEQALIVGDTNQLEPVVEVDAREEARVIRRARGQLDLARLEPFRTLSTRLTSAQSLGRLAVKNVPRLRDHFRCQPEIIAISNRLCDYDLRIHTEPGSLHWIAPRLKTPVLGVHVTGLQESFLGSWRNPAECRTAIALAQDLIHHGVSPSQIALLTPYRGQLRALRDGLRAAGLPFDDGDTELENPQGNLFGGFQAGTITTGTVHRFQGGERDVVIFSAVVTEDRSLPFLNQRKNLVNVAVSRARLHFVLIGHGDVLARGPVTAELVRSVPEGSWL